jgi:hypothetical protein
MRISVMLGLDHARPEHRVPPRRGFSHRIRSLMQLILGSSPRMTISARANVNAVWHQAVMGPAFQSSSLALSRRSLDAGIEIPDRAPALCWLILGSTRWGLK